MDGNDEEDLGNLITDCDTEFVDKITNENSG